MNEDADEAACFELGRRRTRLVNIIGVACVVVGLAVSGAVFLALLQLQFRYLGEAELSFTIAVAVIVGVGGSVFAGFRLLRWILRLRAPSWIDELSANHRSRREQLAQIASLW